MPQAPDARAEKGRALVVEDDPDIVELLVHYLSADDATWNNGRNNVAARRIVNIPSADTYVLN